MEFVSSSHEQFTNKFLKLPELICKIDLSNFNRTQAKSSSYSR